MPGPIKLLLLIIAGLVGSAAQAQLLGPAFESGITLTQEDLDKMRQTVNQQIHGKPVGTTSSWANPSSKNSGAIKLIKKFKAYNMQCETHRLHTDDDSVQSRARTLRIQQLPATRRELENSVNLSCVLLSDAGGLCLLSHQRQKPAHLTAVALDH